LIERRGAIRGDLDPVGASGTRERDTYAVRTTWHHRIAAIATLLATALIAVPAASARDTTVKSFDGTKLVVHFFPAANLAAGHRAPTILVGPGWGSPGDTNPNSATAPSVGIVGLGPLRQAGYNVLTWDPRGFGHSGGTVEVDSPSYEGRDVSALIDFVARQPEALLDRPGDPRVGMAGGSYGGGIQLVAAAGDRRIDAIAPDIAWHSLVTSLDKNGAPKTGWSSLLYLAGAGHSLDPHISSAQAQSQAGVPLSAANMGFFASRGPGALVGRIRVPTLLIEGTVDDLFTLQEAVTNYGILHAHGVPTKMLWFCGGHGDCDFPQGDTSRVQRDTLAWFGRYLKQNRKVATGPGFEWVDQRGHDFHAAGYPLASAPGLSASGRGQLTLSAIGGSGPLVNLHPAGGVLGLAADGVAPARATNAVNVSIRNGAKTKLLVGAPELTLTYRGTAPTAATHVLAQIVDDATGKVLGNQITPIAVSLDGRSHTVRLPLEIIAATATRGTHFTLQLVAQSTAYNVHPMGGSVSFTHVVVLLPAVQ
jgi:ABC-2 type transport system ATP-binding protein